jgi:hypothetical protein
VSVSCVAPRVSLNCASVAQCNALVVRPKRGDEEAVNVRRVPGERGEGEAETAAGGHKQAGQ